MVRRDELIAYCHEFLQVDCFHDYCPNGLQVEGNEHITHLLSAVTASQAAINECILRKADLLLVHHGYFWKNETPVLKGMKQRRIKALLGHDINLAAYHLPLDAHRQLGNNVLLAKQLGIRPKHFFAANDLVLLGQVKSHSGAEFKRHIYQALGREPLHIGVERPINQVALCTGAAQAYLEDAIAQGADAFISGEISENTYHVAIENNVHYFAAGHHATERYGVQALGEHLAEKFDLLHEFFDEPNPV